MKSFFLLALIVSFHLSASSIATAQDSSVCGDPPPVANEDLKGEIKGKAQLLTKYLGGAELAGKIETSRTEIFSKYPDAEESRSNAYFEYQVCVLVMGDRTKSNTEKLKTLTDTRREFSKPIVKPVRLNIRVSPDTVGITPGGFTPVTYRFTESSGVDVTIIEQDVGWYLLDGTEIGERCTGCRILGGTFTVSGNGYYDFIDNVYLPPDIVRELSVRQKSLVHLRTIFKGEDSSGRPVTVKAVLKIAPT